jgi:three-Cys-motif partner protein
MSDRERPKRFKTEHLFPLPKRQASTRGKPLTLPVWTASKARLIERYLGLFVRITRHGTYIDGFAGPQYPDVDEYAAKLVVESEPTRRRLRPFKEPPRLRHFYLFESDGPKCELLRQLERKDPDRVKVFEGDFNQRVDEILHPERLKPTEATFCLLDQHTFECQWATVKRLADYKRESEYKIELFYFLANWWLDRAFAGLRDEERARAWWGSDEWRGVARMSRPMRAEELKRRFRDELGYRYSASFPIHGVEDRDIRVMYYMVHASDHPEALKLMRRAYDKLRGRDGSIQLEMYPEEDM